MAFRKRRSGGGGGAAGASNVRTIILGVIVIVIGLIMLGIAMDVVSPLLTGGTNAVNWTRYPGGEQMLKLFPLLMMISLVLFGGVMVCIGYGGQAMDVRGSIMTTITVIVAVIMLPLVVSATNTAYTNAGIDSYTGLKSFLGLVPLLYVVGLLFVTGMVGFRSVRGKLPKGG
jgi:1,4-dihydroxy-2-naphthoate octaprenyltransferase